MIPNTQPLLKNIFAALFFIVSLSMSAQEITILAPTMLPASPHSAIILPTYKQPWKIDCPQKLKKSTEFSYVILDIEIDESGQSDAKAATFYGTEPILMQAVKNACATLSFQPATLRGRPISAYCRLVVIFNPLSAASGNPDASASVVAAAPVVISDKDYAALKASKKSFIISGTINLDAEGAITGWALSEKSKYAETYRDQIEKTLASWKFSPARAGGNPVASKLPAKFLLLPAKTSVDDMMQSVVPPQVLKQVPPTYPSEMQGSEAHGIVIVEFEVNTKGKAQNPVVKKSDNAGFNQAALDAIGKWKFKPSTKDGVPQTMKMQMAIQF